jgi:hypothetical protein
MIPVVGHSEWTWDRPATDHVLRPGMLWRCLEVRRAVSGTSTTFPLVLRLFCRRPLDMCKDVPAHVPAGCETVAVVRREADSPVDPANRRLIGSRIESAESPGRETDTRIGAYRDGAMRGEHRMKNRAGRDAERTVAEMEDGNGGMTSGAARVLPTWIVREGGSDRPGGRSVRADLNGA